MGCYIMNVKKMIAKGITVIAVKKTYKTVGKSFPIGMHEVEMPEILQEKRTEKKCV